jgi:hypothetical protein
VVVSLCSSRVLSRRCQGEFQRHCRAVACSSKFRGEYANRPCPLPEQYRIVAEIETQFTRLDAGVAALKRVQVTLRRDKTRDLKQAMMQELLTGKTRLI